MQSMFTLQASRMMQHITPLLINKALQAAWDVHSLHAEYCILKSQKQHKYKF